LAQDPELLGDFVVEARDHLRAIETRLLDLEQDPTNTEAIHSVFRSFHTIKGLAGFLDLEAVHEVAHETETALDEARNHRLAVTPDVIDVVLAGADYLRLQVARIDDSLQGRACSPELPAGDLVARIRALTRKEAATPEPASEEPACLPTPLTAQPQEGPAAAGAIRASEITGVRSVKVDTAKLDFLVDMVGELVIAQSMVRHDPLLGSMQNQRLTRNLSQMARITADVQKTAMAMRMVPVGQLFQRMARLVRDLARKSGKRIELITDGEDTELDRNIVEELADPVMHMVRNSIDHGIETPEDRTEAGKPATGAVRLKAWHQAGHILLEISDDGRGIDRDRVLAKARERGLVSDGEIKSESEIYSLIFEPGFSTAKEVTDISGRGVGMDVVRRHIQKLRGRIEIHSTPGKGTRFLLKLPLTLAIIDGLVVKTGEERYIVPLFAVSEMLRPTEEMIWTVQGREEMALVRGKLLPVVRLYRRFGVTPRSEDPCQSLLVVTESAGRPFCLMVDELLGKQEVVIKTLGETMKQVQGVAGGAILGDGRVGLILDVEGIFGRKADG
jgi:two-component system chemotaxis sensor kinase CheA